MESANSRIYSLGQFEYGRSCIMHVVEGQCCRGSRLCCRSGLAWGTGRPCLGSSRSHCQRFPGTRINFLAPIPPQGVSEMIPFAWYTYERVLKHACQPAKWQGVSGMAARCLTMYLRRVGRVWTVHLFAERKQARLRAVELRHFNCTYWQPGFQFSADASGTTEVLAPLLHIFMR